MLSYNSTTTHYGEGNTGRPDYAQNIYDSSLDRAWTYDQVGRLIRAYSGKEARAEWGREMVRRGAILAIWVSLREQRIVRMERIAAA